MSYSLSLPSYSVGVDCYNEIPHFARYYGKKAVVIGGKTAMEKTKDALLKAIEDSDMEILDFIWYGGDATYENGNMLVENETVKSADIIFGVGGGRCCDTCKYVADVMDKPLFTFPTVASNCAAVTSICVMYNPDGTFKDYYYPKLAEHTFINTAVIADSPEELLWAGIGDALSKEYEVVFSSDSKKLMHTPLMGRQLSRICTDPLIEGGKKSIEDIKTHTPSTELEQVALDIIISTGIVSNLTTKFGEYYYNGSIAHCIYYGSTVTKEGHKHLHGEVVALGVLFLLQYSEQYDEYERIAKFNMSVGLPVCFDDVEITEDEFEVMVDKAMNTAEWENAPEGISKERFLEAMKRTNEEGRKFKERNR
jgi:glycerol dehydrogenase-like iron-containing ADH family enzyme